MVVLGVGGEEGTRGGGFAGEAFVQEAVAGVAGGNGEAVGGFGAGPDEGFVGEVEAGSQGCDELGFGGGLRAQRVVDGQDEGCGRVGDERAPAGDEVEQG